MGDCQRNGDDSFKIGLASVDWRCARNRESERYIQRRIHKKCVDKKREKKNHLKIYFRKVYIPTPHPVNPFPDITKYDPNDFHEVSFDPEQRIDHNKG